MKTRKTLTILFMVCLFACVSYAAPIGTAFTYQGHLLERSHPADGLYDLQFKLYDANEAGIQKGPTIDFNDLDVIDGHFCVELDFGSDAFNGDARWLEMTVAHADGSDSYTLDPRQEITPTPYALQTRGIFVDNALNVGIGTSSPTEKLTVENGTIKATSSETTGKAVYGYANNIGDVINYGGYFSASGSDGRGVYGFATGSNGRGVFGYASNIGDVKNYGGYFQARGEQGRGVYGYASSNTSYTNYGGYFLAAGTYGMGVYGKSTGGLGAGVYGEASGLGVGVWGYASESGDWENYGGFFEAEGAYGQGVYGRASNSGDYTNYGGYFQAAGTYGMGVYGYATGSDGWGVYGEARGGYGRGVYGEADNSGNYRNYGGYFKAAGSSGRGVLGYATGSDGRGVVGYATGSSGIGVEGDGQDYDFYATGPGTNYGSSSSIRWKRDIRPIDEALEKVMNLRGVYFNWDAEHGGGHDVGMVAEEVGKILPEIVEYEENGIDATGMDYSKLTPLLVEAVKALKTELDDLRKENTNLRNRVESMEKMITDGSRLRVGVK